LAVLKQLDPERMEALIAQMLMLDSKDSAATLKHVGKALRHPIASHFIEKALQLCSPETYVRIYSDFFRHNIVEYGKDASANYVVQQVCHRHDTRHDTTRETLLTFSPVFVGF
jgi:hypothetical protein